MTEVVSKFWRRYLEQQEAERKLLARRIQDQIGQKLLLIHNGILKRKAIFTALCKARSTIGATFAVLDGFPRDQMRE